MKIHDDHLYHGAALIQIAEHRSFTAINQKRTPRSVFQNSYVVNDVIGIHLKYASRPSGKAKEYVFTFNASHLSELASLAKNHPKTFVALVCVKDREICCLSYAELQGLIADRKASKGSDEQSYMVLLRLPPGKAFRAYTNAAGVKHTMSSAKPLIIARNAFPASLFE